MLYNRKTLEALGLSAMRCLFVIFGLCLGMLPTGALAGCTGNGCEHFSYSVQSGCVYLTNSHGNQRLRAVGTRAIPKYVFYVPPNSTVPANASVTGNCMGGWYRDYEVKLDG